MDETGFESWSLVSYSWSKVGEQKRQEQTHCRRRISLLGLWEPKVKLTYGLSFGGVDSQTYLCLMRWQALRAQSLFTRTGVITIVVQDNAPIHTSKAVQSELEGWRRQGLVLFQLPKYCSELNLIEGEWHHTKAHHIHAQMFEDHYELAKGVIRAVRDRGQSIGCKVHRFNFNTGRTIRSSLLTT